MEARPYKLIADTDITVLYEPEHENDCAVDILFVHGLHGHPRNTWTYSYANELANKNFIDRLFTKNKDENLEIFWPENLLPEDCPAARIMTWGYDSTPASFCEGPEHCNSFYSHANDLLYVLGRKRRNYPNRPLIFVVHSLGGIIVKQALLFSRSAEDTPEIQKIESSTDALVFLGTPHRVGGQAGWGEIATTIAAASLYDLKGKDPDVLQVHGQHLAELEERFGKLLVGQKFRIYNYHETVPFKGIKGFNGKIVDPWAATFGAAEHERIDTISATHTNIGRFGDKSDTGYVKIVQELALLVEERRKFRVDLLADEYSDFISSLRNGITIGVPDHIMGPHPDTCRWISSDPRVQAWLLDQHGIFAISGTAGSGKSTLMKHLHESTTFDELFGEERVFKACFFFNDQGMQHEKTALGMLRGLLCHFLDQSIDFYQSVLPELREVADRTETKTIKAIEWTEDVLKRILTVLVERSEKKKIMVLVDAMDECAEGDRQSIVKFFHEWFKTSQKTQTTLDICFSLQPGSGIDVNRSEYLTGSLLLQNENYRDIVVYVNSMLGSQSHQRRKVNYYVNFAAKVAGRALGVFLWVVLILPTLRRAIDRGDNEIELQKLLEDIPPWTDDLYRGILTRLDPSFLVETMRMLQMTVLAKRPLFLDEFHHAIAFGPNARYDSIAQWEESPEYIELHDMIHARLHSRSGGLLETREAPFNEVEKSLKKREEFRSYYNSTKAQYKTAFYLMAQGHAGIDSSSQQMAKSRNNSNGSTGKSSKRAASTASTDDLECSPVSTPDATAPGGGGSNPKQTEQRHSREGSRHDSLVEEDDTVSQSPAPQKQKQQKTKQETPLRWNGSQYTLARRDSGEMSQPRETRQVIRFVHESVKHFFVKGNGFAILFDLIQEKGLINAGPNPYCASNGSYLTGGHEFIISTFLHYLHLEEVQPLVIEQLSEGKFSIATRRFPLARYISEHILNHLSETSHEPETQKTVFHRLMEYAPSSVDRYICWAAHYNILSWIDVVQELGMNVDTPESSYGLPMRMAVQAGHTEMVERLVDAGANVNGVTGGTETSLWLAYQQEDSKMVQTLRDLGAVMVQCHYLPPPDLVVNI